MRSVPALELAELIASKGISSGELAQRLDTGRLSLARLPDPENEIVTLETLRKEAELVGRRGELLLVAA